MFAVGWIDDPTALRCPLERVAGQYAAAAASRSFEFPPPAHLRSHRGPQTAATSLRPWRGRSRRNAGASSKPCRRDRHQSDRSSAKAAGSARAKRMPSISRPVCAFCRLEPHIRNQRVTDVASRARANPLRRRSATGMDHDAICAERKEQVVREKSVDATGGRQCTQLKPSIDQYRVHRVLSRRLLRGRLEARSRRARSLGPAQSYADNGRPDRTPRPDP